MVEELAAVLNALRKEPVQEQLNALNEVVRDIFTILLQVPEMMEDQIQDLKTQISTLSGDLEHTRAQLKEMQRTALPPPSVPPPAPRSNGNKVPNLAHPPNAIPTSTTPQSGVPPSINSPTTAPEKPNVHVMVMRELKEMLERRKKYTDSQN